MNAASGGTDDIVESGKVLDEKPFGRRRFFVTAAVGHWLATAGLIERIGNFDAEPLEQLEGRDANFGKEGVHIARNEQCDPHRRSPRFTADDLPLFMMVETPAAALMYWNRHRPGR
jgi:hypothetical protein